MCTRSVDPVDEDAAGGFVRWIVHVLKSREEYQSSTAGGRDEDDPSGTRRALVEPKAQIVAAISALMVRAGAAPQRPPHAATRRRSQPHTCAHPRAGAAHKDTHAPHSSVARAALSA